MTNKLKIIISALIILLIIILGIVIIGIVKKNNENSDNMLSNDYIAVFHGGVGERTYETYIYKIDNNKDNYGFKYINVTNTTKSWGDTNWISKITGKGEFNSIEGVFAIAEKNGAYSYVTLPNDNSTYTIEQFQKMCTEK